MRLEAFILLGLAVWLLEARAQEFPAPAPEISIASDLPELAFNDDDGTHRSMTDLQGLAVILLPIYTRCQATCPLAVEHLKRELGRERDRWGRHRVLIFSFDPTDTPERLRQFRQAHALPAAWMIGSTSPAMQERFLKALGVQLARTRFGPSTDFVHSDVLVFLTPKLRVSTFLPGNAGATSIMSALRQARAESEFFYAIVPSILIVAIFGAILCVFLAAELWARGL